MKKQIIHLVAISIVFLVFTSSSINAQTADQAIASAKQLKQLSNKYDSPEYRQLLQPRGFSGKPAEQVEEARQWIAEIKNLEESDIADIKHALKEFESTFGSDLETIKKNYRPFNDHINHPGYDWSRLNDFLTKPRKTREHMANSMVIYAKNHQSIVDSFTQKDPSRIFDEAKLYLQAALEFVPDYAPAKKRLSAIDGEKKDHLQAKAKEIDEKEFGPHSANFQGPGDPNKLAAAVKDFLSTSDSGKKSNAILAVRIAGDWQVAEKAILGETLNWGLPVHVAYRQKDDPETAKVIALTMVTRETTQAPPFKHQYVGDYWFVRTANLPAQSAPVGLIGGLMRFGLSLLLVVTGLVLARPFVTKKLPKTNELYENTKSFWPVLGIVVLAVGVSAFLFSIFSPLGDILPQAAAIVAGLYLGLEILLRQNQRSTTTDTDTNSTLDKTRDKARQTVEKAQGVLRDNANNIRQLGTVRVPLGGVCVALGLMHLLLGGWIFV